MMGDSHKTWKPSPELLAAYADGELDSRDDAVELRGRIEAWLAQNPRAAADLAKNNQLKTLFERTRPPSPSAETWREVLHRVENPPSTRPTPVASTAWPRGAVLVAAGLLVAVLVGIWNSPTAPVEPFPVASDRDVEIVYVEGNALESLVIGQPLPGVLELAEPGEVAITSVSPASRDNMVPTVQTEGPRRPMIWAKLEGEDE